MTPKEIQPSTLDLLKVQETVDCTVSRAPPAQAIQQHNSREMSADLRQVVPGTPGDHHLPQAKLRFHKRYLIQRMRDTQYAASGPELFKEIQARGFQGVLRNVQNLLSKIRYKQSPRTDKAGLLFYSDYLTKRMRDTQYTASGTELFREIQTKGYRGSLRRVQQFLKLVRRDNCPPEACLAFHHDYLIKRIEETSPNYVSVPKLLKEIQTKGYRGSIDGVHRFVSTIRRSQCPPEACLAFHRDYLIKRMEETRYLASGSQLFKEIQAKGYRGSVIHIRNFLSMIRQNRRPPEACLAFHHDYLIKRMEETGYLASGSQLFREIQAKGYQGPIVSLRNFLSMIRQNRRPPEACLAFHEDYLAEKLQEESHTLYISTPQLFKDMQTRGYRGTIGHLRKKLKAMRREIAFKKAQTEGYGGSIKAVQNFLTTSQRTDHSPEMYLSFHKSDLIKKIKEVSSHHISATDLFKDIQAKGYRGSIRTVQQFVAVIPKNNFSQEKILKSS